MIKADQKLFNLNYQHVSILLVTSEMIKTNQNYKNFNQLRHTKQLYISLSKQEGTHIKT